MPILREVAATPGVVVAVAVTALSLVALVEAERREARAAVYASKPLASAGFVVLGLLERAERPSSFATILVVGLVLAAGGDIALMFRTGRSFLVGLVLFLLGHLAYVAACLTRAGVEAWVQPAALAPLAAAVAAFLWLRPHLGRMLVPVIAYVVVITAMVVAALAVGEPILVLGAVLFFASDLAVARERFVKRSFVNRLWGLPAYYAGQILLALSIAAG